MNLPESRRAVPAGRQGFAHIFLLLLLLLVLAAMVISGWFYFSKKGGRQNDFKKVSEEITANGKKTVYDQYYKGLPVFGAQKIVRTDGISSTEVALGEIDIKPKFTPTNPKRTLGIHPETKKLVWLVVEDTQNSFLDANTGELIDAYGTVYQAENRQVYDGLEKNPPTGTLLLNEQGAAPNLPAGKPDAESLAVYSNMKAVYDYYYARQDRDGIDGQGGTMNAVTHYRWYAPAVWNNSAWDDTTQKTYFGTGWGTALDVVGHEWTHGVVSYTAGLQYSNQSGALDEAYADIFGTFVEWYKGTQNWTIGEGNNNIIRDLKNPGKSNNPAFFGDKNYQAPSPVCNNNNDYCGVHNNSTVISKMAQLLVEGGILNNQIILPLGIEKTERLLYYVLTERLTKTSKFKDFCKEMIDSADKGFKAGSAKYEFSDWEKTAVSNACVAAKITKPNTPDDKIVILKTDQDVQSFNTLGCNDPHQVTFYVLAQAYGNEEITGSHIEYQLPGDTKWQVGTALTSEAYQKRLILIRNSLVEQSPVF